MLTKTDLQSYMYDPVKLQQVMLDNIEKSTNGNFVITDPTNPFMMLMELAVTMGANSITEPIGMVKQLYSNLAETPSDLLHHLSDNELVNVFSTPATANLVFYINVKDLYSNGYRATGNNYVETVLTKDTEVIVAGITFTLLNDINIKLYDTGATFVEQQQNTTTNISVKNLGVLSSGIVNFTDGEPWVVFETLVKQVKKHTITKAITPSEGFNIITNIKNSYYYSDIMYKNTNTNNIYTPLNKVHNELYINPAVPSCFIDVMDKTIGFKIPDVYLIDGGVSGNIKIDLYETDGAIYLPLNKYDMTDFAVNIISKGTTVIEATIPNIRVLSSSRNIVEGGKNSLTTAELKNNIINNSTGAIDVPVTDNNIVTKGLYSGYEIFKAMDTITDRLYIGNKNLPTIAIDNIYATPDILFNTLGITLDSIPVTKNVVKVGDYLIIKSGTVFKDNNGVIEIVSDVELAALDGYTSVFLIDTLKNTKYFFTPYYYIIDTVDLNSISSKVYVLNKPFLDSVIIKAKNNNILPKVNLDKFQVTLDDVGYKLYFTLISNADFQQTNLGVVKGQLSIQLINSSEKLYFEATYDATNNLLVFNIDTDLVIDVNNNLTVANGTSTITNRKISLVNNIEVILYTLDTDVVDDTNYLTSEVVLDSTLHKVVFGKEQLTLTLGEELVYMWNMLYNTYTERKYATHTSDKLLKYAEDVYTTDPVTGAIFNCVTDPVTGNLVPEYTKIHSAGDTVLDANGVEVFEYKTGDIILGTDGLPVIDIVSGVKRNIDVLMLDYEFKRTTATVYQNYLSTVLDTLYNWLTVDMVDFNKVLLDNTKILYKSYKSSGKINIASNNTTSSIDYLVKPLVKLYVQLDSYTAADIEVLKFKIGTVIHENLNKDVISSATIKDEIMLAIGSNVVGVKVTNIDTVGNAEVFNIVDKTKRLVLNKILYYNSNNELIVKYDIGLDIIAI